MKMNDFFDEAFENDEELSREYELLETKYNLIEALIKFRKENRISQKEFAEKIGVKQQAVSRFEKGEIDPRLSFIEKILIGMNTKIIFESKDYINSEKVIKFTKKRAIEFSDNNFYINDVKLYG